MKVKQQPGDFRVEELTAVVPGPNGDFAFYRLDKSGWTTPDALQIVQKRWGIDWRRLSYGGLKDRHGETSQFFTILRGPARNLSQQGVTVTHLGQVSEAYTSHHITANRFDVTVRHLTPSEESVAATTVEQVRQTGLPNYFDDQRFGSVDTHGDFVGREMVRGRFEAALKLAMTAPYEHDRADQKREKAMLRAHWGNWPQCRATLRRGPTGMLVNHLVNHPGDFRGALARLRPELGSLYLSAYQSHLWNRMVDRWLRQTLPANDLGTIPLRLGDYAVPLRVAGELKDRWRELTLPLPSARQKPEPGAEWYRIAESVLAEEGLTLATLKVPGLHKPFFSKGERAAFLTPQGLRAEAGSDELNHGRRKLQLAFELPRGSYATMIVKRITSRPQAPGTPGRGSGRPPGRRC